jgi:hypothetical protein
MAQGELIIVRCMTVASEPTMPIPSMIEHCYRCHAEVWLSHETAHQIDGLLAKGAKGTALMCEHCPPPVGAEDSCQQAILAPMQIERLRQRGMSDSKIAHLTALMIVARGESPETTWDRITAEPEGPLSKHYAEVFASVAQQLIFDAHRN